MKHVLQQRNRPGGDCIRACLASILELDIEQVPDFTLPEYAQGFSDASGTPGWYLAIQTWLSGRGLALFEVRTETKKFAALPFASEVLIYGATEKGTMHAICGKLDGSSVVPLWNPSGGDIDCFPNGFSSIALLVAISPSRMSFKPALRVKEVAWQARD